MNTRLTDGEPYLYIAKVHVNVTRTHFLRKRNDVCYAMTFVCFHSAGLAENCTSALVERCEGERTTWEIV